VILENDLKNVTMEHIQKINCQIAEINAIDLQNHFWYLTFLLNHYTLSLHLI